MPDTPTTNPESVDALVGERDELRVERDALKLQRDRYRQLYLEQLELIRKLELGLVGRGRERDLGDPNQISLAMMGVPAPAPSPETTTTKVEAHERVKPTGRQRPPENLPVVTVEVLPDEVQQRGLENIDRIGEESSEVVERRRAGLVNVKIVRGKFVEKSRDRLLPTVVHQAEPAELPIQRGLAGPGLLADTLLMRFHDHLPLHRQERIFGREGWQLSRQTICNWHLSLAELVAPLVHAMHQDALRAPYVCMDATGVLVQDLEKCRNAHFFVLASPERHVLFFYSPKHDSAAVDRVVEGFKGHLVVDAHAVYDHLFAEQEVVEVACWAHARRYFFKALASDRGRAERALEHIGKLFGFERQLKNVSPDDRRRMRAEKSLLVVDAFEAWCDAQAPQLVDESPISRAIRYATNQRAALRRFLDDGRLPLHNNWSERELRREAVGRKNWLFLGSDEGGAANAAFVSLIASCQLHGVAPDAYLRDLLCLLPGWDQTDVLALSPLHWRATTARPEVEAALAGNVYRQVALGERKPDRGE